MGFCRIKLTKGLLALVDEEDEPSLVNFSWRAYVVDTARYPLSYAIRDGRPSAGEPRTVFMHRQIMCPPKGFVVDHFDNDGLNNQRTNLRIITRSGNNGRSRPRDNKNGFPGVSMPGRNGLYYGRVAFCGKQYYTRSYSNPEDASAARDGLLLKLHGSFVIQNNHEPGDSP